MAESLERPGDVRPPDDLRRRYAGWSWEAVYRNDLGVLTYRLRQGPQKRFLKLAPPGCHPSLAAEADRIRWAEAVLPVPRVVEDGAGPAVDWMVTTAVPGSDATDAAWSSKPRELTRLLARGLRRFHTAPTVSCPFDFGLDAALAHARSRLEAGQIDPARDFHPEHAHLSAEDALGALERDRPANEDTVVCHGDYCLPNILLEDGQVSGFVDLGELGLADRWWDLAAATWSLAWNLGPGFEEEFLAAYGIGDDPDRVAYYRLLYDVVS